jgi:platelet-activating factor acetylhydrolase IB subunit alpha
MYFEFLYNKVWDHESGDYVRTLKGHTNSVTCLDFSPTGALLVSSSTDLSMKLWDFSTYSCIRTLRGHDHTISAVQFIPSIGSININPSSNSAISDSIKQVDAESAGSQFLLSGSRDKTVKVWEVASGFCDQTLTDHSDWVRCLAVRRHDAAVFATAGNDTVIYIYDTATRKKIGELRGHEHVVESIAFICEASPGSAQSKSNVVTKHLETARSFLASGGRDRSVRLWNILTLSCLHVFQIHDNWVRSVLIHPSGNYIFAAGDDRSIRVLDINSQRCLRHLEEAHPHFVTSLSMHPTLPILVSASVDTTVKCWMLD